MSKKESEDEILLRLTKEKIREKLEANKPVPRELTAILTSLGKKITLKKKGVEGLLDGFGLEKVFYTVGGVVQNPPSFREMIEERILANTMCKEQNDGKIIIDPEGRTPWREKVQECIDKTRSKKGCRKCLEKLWFGGKTHQEVIESIQQRLMNAESSRQQRTITDWTDFRKTSNHECIGLTKLWREELLGYDLPVLPGKSYYDRYDLDGKRLYNLVFNEKTMEVNEGFEEITPELWERFMGYPANVFPPMVEHEGMRSRTHVDMDYPNFSKFTEDVEKFGKYTLTPRGKAYRKKHNEMEGFEEDGKIKSDGRILH